MRTAFEFCLPTDAKVVPGLIGPEIRNCSICPSIAVVARVADEDG
jgi:hypothetical protein